MRRVRIMTLLLAICICTAATSAGAAADRGWGVGWNLQAGYRSLRVMGLEKSAANLRIDMHGPIALISVEF